MYWKQKETKREGAITNEKQTKFKSNNKKKEIN